MENKELYRLEVDKKIENISLEDGSIEFKFDTHSLSLTNDHNPDCCEHVYADFSILKFHASNLKKIGTLIIKGVENMGFLLCLDDSTKIFIPCYNYQNGYYSSNLSLIVKNGNTKVEIDISNLVEDHIN